MTAVFVFGSNLAGNHAGGAARNAVEEWGACIGYPEGLYGQSYALPTMDGQFRTLPLDQIAKHVARFVSFAAKHPRKSFLVTAIGCGIARLDPADIAPLFAGASENVFLSEKLVAALRPKGGM